MKSSASSSTRKIAAFLVLTAVFSGPFYFLIVSAGKVQAADIVVLGLMWAPGAAALATLLIYQRNLRGIGWGWCSWRFLALAYAWPLAGGMLVYGLVWTTGLGGFSTKDFLTGLGSAWVGRRAQSPPAWHSLLQAE
jgi:CAAX protease family protein